jgi:hypothetical protein
MKIRFFDWRDLPVLLRYRTHGFFFDSARFLMHGPTLIPAGALLSYIAPATGIYTFVCQRNSASDGPLLGQVLHSAAAPYARLTFLAPESAPESDALPTIIEHMLVTVGERGGLRLLAEVDEHTSAYEALRRSSFAIYARQRIWQLTGQPGILPEATPWQQGGEQDLLAMRLLYNNVVPGLVQQVEDPPAEKIRGAVYRQSDELMAYVEIRYGNRGIWVQPFVHPDADQVAARLADLLQCLPRRRSRPIYICVRSYQSWLESAIEALGANPGPLQAVLVKHLTVPQRLARKFALPAIEGGQPEASAPFVHSENHK